jgi:hypothetical protein
VIKGLAIEQKELLLPRKGTQIGVIASNKERLTAKATSSFATKVSVV